MTPIALALAFFAAGEQQPVFSARVDLVHVVVSVTSKDGTPVRDLRPNDFVVKEDGADRKIEAFLKTSEAFDSESAPVDLVLLFDTSISMNPDLGPARRAAVEFTREVPSLRGRSIVAFDSGVRPWAFDDRNLESVLDNALFGDPGKETRLFDAVVEGARRVQAPFGRKIIVAITDGEDRGSSADLDSAIRELQGADVAFYAVSYAEHLRSQQRPHQFATSGAAMGGFGQPVTNPSDAGDRAEQRRVDQAHGTLVDLAKASGGFVVNGSARNLAKRLEQIREDVSAQYVLGFSPRPGGDTANHRLKIEVARKGVRVRYRDSYGRTPPGK